MRQQVHAQQKDNILTDRLAQDKQLREADAPRKEKHHNVLYRRDVDLCGHWMSSRLLRDREKSKRQRAQIRLEDAVRARQERALTPDRSSSSPGSPAEEDLPSSSRAPAGEAKPGPPRVDVSPSPSCDSDAETLSCDGNDKGSTPSKPEDNRAAQAASDREAKDWHGVFSKTTDCPELRLSTDRNLRRKPPNPARRRKRSDNRKAKKKAKAEAKKTAKTAPC